MPRKRTPARRRAWLGPAWAAAFALVLAERKRLLARWQQEIGDAVR